MNESLITLGRIMAKVSENSSGEISTAPGHDAKMTFLFTTESEENRIIVTPQMCQLGDAGYLPIAIARIDSNNPTTIFLRAATGLSQSLQTALEHEGCDLVHYALSCLADGQDGSRVSN